MSRESLGEFEHLILLSILRQGPDIYGVPIIREIEDRTGRIVSQAAAYLTLRRLEEKGWITSHLGEPTPQRGGRHGQCPGYQPGAQRTTLWPAGGLRP